MTDKEIRKKIAAEKRRRKNRQRLIALCAALVIALAAGIIAGRAIGLKLAADDAAKTPKYISTAADVPIVQTAIAEVGDKGGEKFWSWAGFGSRVEWCACFASWCEDQQGWIDEGTAPSFTVVSEGSDWFIARNRWLDAGSKPEAGDLIFLDWEQDGWRDHVGIVAAVKNGRVFTVEGNSSDRCRQKRYMLDDPVIYGYGQTES